MTIIGKRTTDLFIGAQVPLYDPATDTTTTYYWSTRSWQTNPGDSLDPNRQYIGLLEQAYDFDFSWIRGGQLGGRSQRNFGQLVAINPDGDNNLDFIFTDGLTVQGQTITYYVGEIGDDLGSMISFQLQGRHIRQSADGHKVIVDLADDGQALDSSIFVDKFQGLGFSIRHDPGEFSTIASAAALNPSTSFVVDVSYSFPPGITLSGDVSLINRAATAGGRLYRLYAKPAGTIAMASRSSGGDVFVDATDISWVADGRWHRVVGRWDGTDLELFHSTRTGGVKSTVSTGMTTIDTSSTAVSVGDEDSGLGTNEYVDIGDVRIAVDTAISDADIIDRMKRPLTSAETGGYEAYVKLNENTGTTSADETGNGHTLTLDAGATWEPTHEGTDEMQGRDKPLSFGRITNAPVVWNDRANGLATLHARGIRGCPRVMEGANRLEVGWPKTKFLGVDFDSGTKEIRLDSSTISGIVRHESQPCFIGPASGQKVVVSGTASNNGTFTLNGDATELIMTVSEAVTDESAVDCYIEVLDTASAAPDVNVWFHSGALEFTSGPTSSPATAEILGDIGADEPAATITTDGSFPEYTPAIMRTIISNWGPTGFAPTFDTNWSINTTGAADATAGVWISPDGQATVRQVLDGGADSIWARWGVSFADSKFYLYVIAAPAGAADITLTDLELLGLKRVQSVAPIGGLTLQAEWNYRPLDDGEFVGAATDADKEELARQFLEAAAVIDSTVTDSYPLAETPTAIRTWLRNQSDAITEAQRRYDILKALREIYEAEVVAYGLDQNPLNAEANITDVDFPTLASGKDFWLVRMAMKDERSKLTVWG